MAVADRYGFIGFVNKAWINLGNHNDQFPNYEWKGTYHLSVCDGDVATGD